MNPRLIEILRTMDIPVFRQGDIRWLGRNLAARNKGHTDFTEALKLITDELRKDVRTLG